MNWDLYNKQDDFGQIYMIGIEKLVNGIKPLNEINYLYESLKNWNDQRLIEYIHTLEYCCEDVR